LITGYNNFRSQVYIVLQLERGKLYCTKVDERVNELSLGVKEYMKNLVPVEEMEQADVSSDFVSHSSLTQMPAVDKVRTLLREGMLIMNEDRVVLRFEPHVAFLVGPSHSTVRYVRSYKEPLNYVLTFLFTYFLIYLLTYLLI